MRTAFVFGIFFALGACTATVVPEIEPPQTVPDAVPVKKKAAPAFPSDSFAPVKPVAQYVTEQQAGLSAAVKGTSLKLRRESNTLILIMAGKAAFRPNSYNMNAGAVNDLKKIAPVLRYFDKTRINVVGHVSEIAGIKEPTARLLSEKRADSAASVLVGAGVPAVRFWIDGKGFDVPLASADTEAGRNKNDRIEFILTPTIR